MMLLVVGGVVLAGFILLYMLSPIVSPKPMSIAGSHVLITGGSSGIGLSVAIEAAKLGANVTLLARDTTRLAVAKSAVEKVIKDVNSQRVVCISCDLTKDYSEVEKVIRQAEQMIGPVDMLVNCAGTSISRSFTDTSPADFRWLMEANYLGSVYATKAVLPGMKERQHGRIVFTSSQAGQLGLYGYTAYSASKFALRGLAESLQMEVKPYNIHVTLSFPPDTDTPGYQEENKQKPRETTLISEAAGLFQPDKVASTLLHDAIHGRFVSYLGMDGWMLATLTCGMSPVTSLWEATQQVLLMGIFRLVSLGYLCQFDKIVKTCKSERDKEAKAR